MNILGPLLRTLRTYRGEYLPGDLTAAFTVAVIAIPQSIAFAMLSNIEPIYGLYSVVVGTILVSLLSSSSHIIGGPTNATCLLLAGSLVHYTGLGTAGFMEVVFLFTFMVGLFQILFGIFNMGRLLNYISHSVIEGFTIGAAFLIIFGQANKMFGIIMPSGLMPFEKVTYILGNISETNLYCLVISLATFLIIDLSKRVHKLVPGELISLIVTGVAVMVFNLEGEGISLVQSAGVSLPSFKTFPIRPSTMIDLVPQAISYSLIALVSAIAITKNIARNTNEKIDINHEFITQGIANIAGSFFQAFAGTGSVSRTALNYYVGARTRLAGIMSGIMIVVFLMFFGRLIVFIPNAALATIIVRAAFRMINFDEIKRYLKSNKDDFVVAAITLVSVMVMPSLDRAVLTGAGISIFLYLYRNGASGARVLHYVEAVDGFTDIDIEDLKEKEDVITILLKGNLYFGMAYDLDDKFAAVENKSTRFILRFRDVDRMDVTVYETIVNFVDRIRAKDGSIKFCGVSADLERFFSLNGIYSHIKEGDMIMKEKRIFNSYEKAFGEIMADDVI